MQGVFIPSLTVPTAAQRGHTEGGHINDSEWINVVFIINVWPFSTIAQTVSTAADKLRAVKSKKKNHLFIHYTCPATGHRGCCLSPAAL